MLGKIYHHIPSNDIKIIIGDVNAQIDQEGVFLGIIGKDVCIRRQMMP
jgi:hypothetical protein